MNKFSIALIVLLITGCSLLPAPYKVPVTQGNTLKLAQVDQLQLGMSTEQVKFVVGSPSIQDPLTPDTWLYIFTAINTNSDTKSSEIKKLTLTFDNGQLIDIRKR